MTHEQSETIEQDGKFLNVFGKNTPRAGEQLPGSRVHDTLDEAIAAAQARSASFEPNLPPQGVSSDSEIREAMVSSAMLKRIGKHRSTDMKDILEADRNRLGDRPALDKKAYFQSVWDENLPHIIAARVAASQEYAEDVGDEAALDSFIAGEAERLQTAADAKNLGEDYMTAMVLMERPDTTMADRARGINAYITSMMDKAGKENSWVKEGWDFASMLIPGPGLEVPRELNEEDAHGVSLEDHIAVYKRMPPTPEKLQEARRLLQRVIKEFEGDRWQIMRVIDDILDPEGVSAINETLIEEALFFVPFGAFSKGDKAFKAAAKLSASSDVRTASKVSKEFGGETAHAAASDPKAAKAMNIDSTSAAASVMPVKAGSRAPKEVEGVGPEMVDAARAENQRKLDTSLEQFKADADNTLLHPNQTQEYPPLNAAERVTWQEKVLLEGKEVLEEFGGVVREMVRIGEEGTRGMTFRFRVSAKPGKGQWKKFQAKLAKLEAHPTRLWQSGLPVGARLTLNPRGRNATIEFDVAYTKHGIDVQPAYDKMSMTNLAVMFKQAADRYAPWLKEFTQAATVGVSQFGRIMRDSQRLITDINKGLSKGQQNHYQDILIRAQNRNKDFTIHEMLGENADWKTIEAYYKFRHVTDRLHFAVNDVRYAQRLFDGWVGAHVGGSTHTVRPRSVTQAYAGLSDGAQEIMIQGARKSPDSRSFKPAQLTKYLADNPHMRLMQITKRRSFTIKKGKKEHELNLVLVNTRHHIRALPRNQVPYRPAYFPKIYKDALFMVSQPTRRFVNGREIDDTTVTAFFDNATEAKEFMRRENIPVNESAEKGPVTFHDLRHKSIDPIHDDRLDNVFGLFADPRTTSKITYGLEKGVPATFSPTEALERNLAYMARQRAFQSYRMQYVERFRRLVAKAKDEGRASLETPADWKSNLNIASRGDKKALALRDMQTELFDMLGHRSTEERVWDGFIENVTDWMEGRQWANTRLATSEGSKPRRVVDRMRSHSVIAGAKTATYHGLLGMFNPSQLLVQSMGFVGALALDPLRAPKYLYQYQAMWWTRRAVNHIHFKNSAEKMKFAADVGKRFGMDGDEFSHLYHTYEQSGLWDAVRANADLAYAESGFSTVPRVLRKVADAGLMFVREGERFAHGFAFLQAANVMKRSGRSFASLTKLERTELTSRAFDLVFNLTSANKAAWQRNPYLALPTQFAQITAKSLENVLPIIAGGSTRFSASEKTRIFSAQALLFGAAGIPFSDWWSTPFARYYSELTGTPEGEIDPTVANTVQNGALGFVSDAMFGNSFDLSRRGSLVSGIEHMYEGLRDADVADALLGAAGSIPHRAMKAVSRISYRTTPLLHGEMWDESPQILLSVLKDVARIASSFSNLHKAEFGSRLGVLVDGNMNVVIDDPTVTELFGLGLGFQPGRMQIYRSLDMSNREGQEALKELTNAMTEVELEYLAGKQTPSTAKHRDLIQSFLLSPYANNPQVLADIRMRVINKMRAEPRFQTTLERFLEQQQLGLDISAPDTSVYTFSHNPDYPTVEDSDLTTFD